MKSTRLIYPFLLALLACLLVTPPLPAVDEYVRENRFLAEFYPVKSDGLEMAWQQVAGDNGENIQYIIGAAKKFNLHPADLANVLIADSASRFAWPGGMPREMPYGFVYSQTGISQIPPGMAASERLLLSLLIIDGARKRFDNYKVTIMQPEKGVDYWFKALDEESYEAMKDPGKNIGVAARYMRRVGDAALSLWAPDARDSLMLDDKSLIPDQHMSWVDEFDWGRVRNYLRDNMLWDRSYEFDVAAFRRSEKRLSELNMMLLYSEYRTAPPFDGSWFFEGMYLVRETRRWLETRQDILDQLKPMKGPMILFNEYTEDYSYFQDEWEMLNPNLPPPMVVNSDAEENKDENTEQNGDKDKKDNKDDSSKDSKKGTRKPRGVR